MFFFTDGKVGFALAGLRVAHANLNWNSVAWRGKKDSDSEVGYRG